MHSRNRRAGILIGKGKTAQEAMDEVGAVVEVEAPIGMVKYQIMDIKK